MTIFLFPKTYHDGHRKAHLDILDYGAAKHNHRTIYELQWYLNNDPEEDLLDVFPKNYTRRLKMMRKDCKPKEPKLKPFMDFRDFRKSLNIMDTARTVDAIMCVYEAFLPQVALKEAIANRICTLDLLDFQIGCS